MRRFVIAVGLTICLFYLAPCAQAIAPAGMPQRPKAVMTPQKTGGPSLEETMAWIKGALATYGQAVIGEVHVTYTLTSTDSCKVIFAEDSDNISAHYQLHNTISVNFKALDPGSGKITEDTAKTLAYDVEFETTNLSEAVELRSTTSQFNGTSSRVGFWVRDKDAAARLMKAMSHAIALCGGKKSTTF